MNHVALMLPQIEQLGGAEIQVMHLARGLRRRGWRVTLIALSGAACSPAQKLAYEGIDIRLLRMRRGLADPAGWLRLRHFICTEHPDILHAHLPHAAWMARWSRLFAPVRVVMDSIHTSACGTLGRRLGYRCSNWLADAGTAVGPSAADAYTKARMVTAGRLIVIPNGVDTEKWKSTPSDRADARAALGIRDEFLWLAAGRLEPVKNFSALLDAFASLDRGARLVIAGSGSLRCQLQSQAAALGIERRLTLPGFQHNLLPLMLAADAFVLPSQWEGLPTVLLEAAACSLPAVATDVPGSRDVVRHGQTGLLAPPRSVPALASAMDKIMRLGPAARAVMGHNARLHAEACFDLGAVVDRWAQYYERLLLQHPTPARRGRIFPLASTCGSVPSHSHHDPPQRDLRVHTLPQPEPPGTVVCDNIVE